MFETIVWATDGSSDADSALPIVTELAGVHGSTVIALHVEQPRVVRDEVREKLVRQIEVLRNAGFEARLEVVTTLGHDPSAAVAHEAAKLGADLIVVGTAGFGELGASLHGGIARGLTYRAMCPVLVVPARAWVTAQRGDFAYAFPWSSQ